jgi:hypothetical protein
MRFWSPPTATSPTLERACRSSRARPPKNGRVPVVELDRLRTAARITDIPSTAGLVYFEDHRGNRLVDVRVEGAAKLALTLPAGSRLFVYSHAGEGETLLQPNRSVRFASLNLRRSTLRQTGRPGRSLEKRPVLDCVWTGLLPRVHRRPAGIRPLSPSRKTTRQRATKRKQRIKRKRTNPDRSESSRPPA